MSNSQATPLWSTSLSSRQRADLSLPASTQGFSELFSLGLVCVGGGSVVVWFCVCVVSCSVVVVCVWFFWEGRSEDEVQLFNYKLISCVSIVFSPVILPVCTSGLETHTVTDCLSARERSESILLFSPV